MSELLIKNCTKATFFNDGYNAVNFLQNADILIKDNYIVRIDKNIERDCAVIDGTNLLAIPGLIDGASSCLTSKISHVLCEDIDFGRFGDTPIYARINPLINIALKNLDSCQLKSILELAIYEAAQSGTTTLIERCSPKELPLFLELCKEYGLRAIAAPILMNRELFPYIDAWGNYDDALQEIDEDKLISWNIDFVKQTKSCLQSAVMGLGSPATISPSLMRKASVAAQGLGCLLVANLNETRHERDICLERYGTTPTNLLEENGVLNSRTLVCGNLFTNHEERKLIRRHDTSAAVLARQSMLDAQITPFIDFLIDDVVTICGSGRCSVNMLQEIKALTISGKLESHKRSQMCAHDSFYAATIGAGRVLKIKLGQIEEGFLADLVLLDIEKPEHIPFTMPIGELVYSMHAEDVKHVIVNGKIIKSNGKLIGHHSKDILDKAKEALEEFWQYARDAGEI